ncbi:MAG: HD-GYP domain-containing protein [Planctomycetota bacterium]
MIALNRNTGGAASDSYVRLPLSAFRVDLVSKADLYYEPTAEELQDAQAATASGSPRRPKMRLYRAADYPVTKEDIQRLIDRGHKALYVSAVDHAAVGKQLFDNLEDLIKDESRPPVERFGVMQAAVALEVDVAFRLIKPSRFVSLSTQIADHITTLMGDSDLVPQSLFDVVQHDYYTFTHVTNSAGYAVLLAEKLGVSDPGVRKRIAAGALLHDIGKRFIPTKILCKPGRLTPEERELIELHPQAGYLDLKNNSELDQAQLMMVYQHHERLDGTGYPVKVLGDEIHDWARMLAVVDVFDALTSDRPYRKPMPIAEAIEFLNYYAGRHYDPEMVRCWTYALENR